MPYRARGKLPFYFFTAKGKVKISKYEFSAASMEDIANHQSYPDSPTKTGRIDNLEITRNIGSDYALRLQAYFIAPQSGTLLNCDLIVST